MRRLALFWFSVLLCVVQPLRGQDALKLLSAEGTHFDIVGVDRQSVNFVEELSERLLVICKRYLRANPEFFPQRVLVALRPADQATFEGHYRIQHEAGGFVRVDFRWDEQLSYPTLCYALMDAYLTRYAIYHYGNEGPDKVKAWTVAALGTQVYIGLRPAVFSGWMEALAAEGTPAGPSLAETAVEIRGKDPSLSPYLLLLAMRNWGIPRDQIARTIEAGVAGKDIQQSLELAIQPVDPKMERLTLFDWWVGSTNELLSARSGRYESLNESRDWLTKMSDFSVLNEAETEINDLRALWKNRENPALQQTLRARRELIRIRLDQVNPAYFNSAVGLGGLYETVLEAEKAHEFIFALTTYLSDFADTKRLHEEALGELEKTGS